MDLKEMFICAKTRDQSANEDGLVMTDELVAVIDGVTAKNDTTWDGMKPGCLARNLLEEELYTTTIRGKDALKFFTALDNAIARNVKRMDPDMPDNDRPKASVLVYNDLLREIWLYGDSQLMINGRWYPPEKKIDRVNAAVRAFVIEEAMLHGTTAEEIREHDIGRDAILPFLRKQGSFENLESEWGCPVIKGNGINPKLIRTWKVEPGDSVVLASDGYPELFDTLEKSEARLAELLEEDPLCIKGLRATKCLQEESLSFDDRTYVRFTV